MTNSNGIRPDHEIMDIDPNLEDIIVPRFDDLVAKGEILWAPYESEPVEYKGFKAVFQLSPHLMKKPIQGANDPDRKTGKGSNPFLHPDPSFVLTKVGPHHTLMLNKYCVYRPSVILHTNDFIPQSNDLTQSDLHAAWTVTQTLTHTPYMMIYNCGIHSGSSQGHKHMQLWPLPTNHDIGFELFPSQATSTEHVTSSIPHVPHVHYVLRLPSPSSQTTPSSLYKAYTHLLSKIHKCHTQRGSKAYNVVLTSTYLCLIPRRSSGGERGAGSNAAGVMGLIWISSEEEKKIWTEQPDLGEFLGFIGLPRRLEADEEEEEEEEKEEGREEKKIGVNGCGEV